MTSRCRCPRAGTFVRDATGADHAVGCRARAMTPLQVVLAGGAGFAAGAVNALAGGGNLITFPVLVALGLPPISANITNTVALSPGYLGGALAQRQAIAAQRPRVRRLAV